MTGARRHIGEQEHQVGLGMMAVDDRGFLAIGMAEI